MIRLLDSPDSSPCLNKRLKSIGSADIDSSLNSHDDSAFFDGGSTASTSSDALYGLSEDVRNYLREQRGIKDLYEWQDQCLIQQMNNPRKNLIVTLPTSGGKTLLAEILILKTLLWKCKDAIFILPFVSLVQEKVKALQPLGLKFNFLVEEYASTRGRIPPIKRRLKKSCYVATIERSQSLINSLIQLTKIDNVGMVIIDEVHMVGEGRNRGAKLEQVITTLHLAAKNTPIIALSATLSNVDEMKKFLNADSFISGFRPVPLTEFVKLGNTVYKVKRAEGSLFSEMLAPDRKVKLAAQTVDPDGISELVNEVVPNASCLVFCPTKKNTESVAMLLTKTLPQSLRQHKLEEKQSLVAQLKTEAGGAGLCPVQRRCIEFGIAYHHAGLTTDERNLLQEAFSNGTLCVICCTSTLAAGVNLPAKRVILRAPMVGNEFLSKQQYRQMSGRAGRAGLDTSGESILLINGKQLKPQLKKTLELLHGDVERCCSSLIDDHENGFGRYLLTMIGLEVVKKTRDVSNLLGQTLASIQIGEEKVAGHADVVLKELVANGLVEQQCGNVEDEDDSLTLTEFGWAVVDSGIGTDIAQHIKEHLLTSVQCLVLSTHLHLLYCIIPFESKDDTKPNWDIFYDEFCSLSESEKKIFTVVSVTEAYLLRRKAGITKTKGPTDDKAERLYQALIIRRLWNNENIWSVANRFRITRGAVQVLSQSCAASASSLTRFVARMKELWALKLLLPDFSKTLTYCAKPELIPLMELQGVKQARANQLFQADFKTPAVIANALPDALMASIEYLSRGQAIQIINSAQMWLREKGELLVEQAEESGISFEELISLSQAS